MEDYRRYRRMLASDPSNFMSDLPVPTNPPMAAPRGQVGLGLANNIGAQSPLVPTNPPMAAPRGQVGQGLAESIGIRRPQMGGNPQMGEAERRRAGGQPAGLRAVEPLSGVASANPNAGANDPEAQARIRQRGPREGTREQAREAARPATDFMGNLLNAYTQGRAGSPATENPDFIPAGAAEAAMPPEDMPMEAMTPDADTTRPQARPDPGSHPVQQAEQAGLFEGVSQGDMAMAATGGIPSPAMAAGLDPDSPEAYDPETGLRDEGTRKMGVLERMFGEKGSDSYRNAGKALMMAGAAIMGTNGNLGEALANGIQAGLMTYDDAMQALKDEEMEARKMGMAEEAHELNMELKRLQIANARMGGRGGGRGGRGGGPAMDPLEAASALLNNTLSIATEIESMTDGMIGGQDAFRHAWQLGMGKNPPSQAREELGFGF